MRRCFVVLCLVTMCRPGAGRLHAATPEQVFAKASPSIVLIEDDEGHGSGVVLTADGLILTCYHVVAFPLDRTVKAKVILGGRQQEKTFDKIEFVGVHPTQDLALIKVKDAGGARFIPVERANRPLRAGEACYAIGNPAGLEGKPLADTITKGLVSAPARNVTGEDVIQTSAAVNPGCSGGALCDGDGKLIGIITFKLQDADNVGFALPTAGLKEEVFKSVKERKGNRAAGIEYEKEGSKWFQVSRTSRGERREVAQFLAYYYYRQALVQLPNEASPHHNLGLLYNDLEEPEIARALFEKAVELDPTMAGSLELLGLIAMNAGEEKKAQEYWYKGMLTTRDKHGASGCADNYAVLMHRQKNYPAAAYCMKWAEALETRPDRVTQRRGIITESIQHLSDAQYACLRDKKDGFSDKDMKDFLANRVTAPPIATVTEIKLPAVSKDVLAKILAGAPDPSLEGLTKKYPEELVDAIPAYGGAYIILQFKELPRVAVFNVAHASIDKYIEADKGAVVAASGGGMLIYQPGKKAFDCWRLDTMEKIGTKAPRIEGVVLGAVGAPDRPDAVLISFATDTSPFARRRYALMHTKDFTLEYLGKSNTFQRVDGIGDDVHMMTDDGLRIATMWRTRVSPAGFVFVRLPEEGRDLEYVYEHKDFGYLLPAADASCIYAYNGLALDFKGRQLKQYGSHVFPIIGSRDLVGIGSTTENHTTTGHFINIRSGDSGAVMGTIPLWTNFRNEWSGVLVKSGRSIVASAHTKRIAVIVPKKKEIHVWKLEATAGAPAGGDVAEPGKVWRRKFDFPAGTKVVIEAGPKGASFDARTMTLTWNVPATQKRGEDVLFLMSVTQPGGEENYHRITARVK